MCRLNERRGLLLLTVSRSGDAKNFQRLKTFDCSGIGSESVKGNSMVEHWSERSLSVNFGSES